MPIAIIFFVLVLAAALMWRYPEYRLSLGAALLLIGGAYGAYFLLSEPAVKSQSAALSADQLALRDVEIIPEPRFVTMRGQVHNLASDADLLEMTLQLSALDCPPDVETVTECIVIGSDDGVARTAVPAGQLRNFEAVFMLRNLPETEGTLRWHYLITATRATPR